MPETTEAAPSLPDLIPAPRKPEEPGASSPRADAPEVVHASAAGITDDHDRPAGERLAFLWTALGALVGSAVVAGLFLAFLALLP